MARQSKEDIAWDMYDEEFNSLSPGEKAAVTRAFNAQPASTPRRRAVPSTPAPVSGGSVRVTIGRVGVNGCTTCLMPKGSTVRDLLNQSKLAIDEDKEGITKQSTGLVAYFKDEVVNGEAYEITPNIDSSE